MSNPKKIRGVCPVQNGIPYTVSIGYAESETCEGTDYAKDKLICEYNQRHKTCKKHECPIWRNAPDRP